MAQVVIRNLEDAAVARLKARAARKGHSLEQELRDIVAAAARPDHEEFRAKAARFRARLASRAHSDSTALIREDRDR